MRSSAPDDGPNTLAIALTFLGIALVGGLMLRDSITGYMGLSMRGDPGPFFLPQLCLAVIGGAGVLLLIRALWLRHRTGRPATVGPGPVDTARSFALPAGMTASLLAMPAAMGALGTTLAVAVFAILWIFLLLWTTRGLSWRIMAEAAVFGGLAALAVDAIFVRLLLMPLPG